MFLYENNITLTNSVHPDAQTVTQANFLTALDLEVRCNGRDIRQLILDSPRKLLYWSPGDWKPCITFLLEQLIDNRVYFFSQFEKKLKKVPIESYCCTKTFRSSWWGNIVYRRFASKNLTDDLSLSKMKTGKFLFAQAMLPQLYQSQEQWKQYISQFRYMDISAIYIRVPTVSIFPLPLGDLLRIAACTEQQILERIEQIEIDWKWSNRLSFNKLQDY